ncbi:phospholipase D family protein [Bacillus infantis]|uniref:phospholipase D family protein n=1 Tax=Bacillus infantis TaxID=324767 RepID=UPI003018F6F6
MSRLEVDKWVWEKGYIKKVVKDLEVKNITIVSAYFSNYGVEFIKELMAKSNLNKDNITLYLSKEFSMNKPGALLEELSSLANVYIVHKEKLHAKVFMFYTPQGIKAFHGSANFTRGGLDGNLELIHEVQSNSIGRLEEFIKHCLLASEKVTDKIIENYKDIDGELKNLSDANQKANRKINEIFVDNQDPFKESDYDLDGYFFTFQDYETFFPKYQAENDRIILKRREVVRNKLLKLNNLMKHPMSKMNLHNNWSSRRRPELITSQISPSKHNYKRLSWICLRYGKHSKDALIGGSKTESHESFIRHACMQISVVSKGVEIGLFHATAAKGCIDRDYLKDNIERLKDKIHNEIAKLKGEQFVWHIYNPNKDMSVHSFNIDKEDPNKFTDFYTKYDSEGLESFCIFRINPDEEHLETPENLVKIAEDKIAKLYPLYRLITWRITN